jgi:hypothetical protein
MKSIKKYFLYLTSIFLILNLIILILWKGIYNFSLHKKDIYSDIVSKEIGITDKEKLDFYKEFWVKRKFKYVKFIGELEQETNNQKYLNITKHNGRYNGINNNCNQKIIFYGSSSLFGYNVKDNQTIPFYFKEYLDKNNNNKYCVFNYGSANHFSTHENIFFQNQFINKKISKNDILIFINGTAENGNHTSKVDLTLEKLFTYTHQNIIDKYKFTIPLTFKTFPIFQIFKLKNPSHDLDSNNERFEEIEFVFQSNIKIRNNLCKNLNLKCFTFLQPLPLISGRNIKSHLNIKAHESKKKYWEEKYDHLKNTENIFDLNGILEINKEISFVDPIHYSPSASNIIAKNILNKIEKYLD